MPFVLGIGALAVSALYGLNSLFDKWQEEELKPTSTLSLASMAVLALGGYLAYRTLIKRR